MLKLLTKKEAEQMYCPWEIGDYCCTEKCMGWIEVHSKVVREDHSGGKARMNDLGLTRHQMPRQEGPPGCMGELILDEQGYCGRLDLRGLEG